MNIVSKTTSALGLQKAIKSIVMAVVLLTAFIASAHAEDWRDRGRGHGQNKHRPVVVDRNWNTHQYNARHYWNQPYYYRQEPRVIYAPPLVYAPPPTYYQEPGISFIIPLNIY